MEWIDHGRSPPVVASHYDALVYVHHVKRRRQSSILKIENTIRRSRVTWQGVPQNSELRFFPRQPYNNWYFHWDKNILLIVRRLLVIIVNATGDISIAFLVGYAGCGGCAIVIKIQPEWRYQYAKDNFFFCTLPIDIGVVTISYSIDRRQVVSAPPILLMIIT